MSSLALAAQPRDQFGKERVAKLRQKGLVPGVVYGTAKTPEHIVVNAHELELLTKRVHGQTILIDVTVAGGGVQKAFLKEVQRDPVTSVLLHVDLYRVDLERPITLPIPIVAVGTAAGVKLGGILETVVRTVEVRCLPANLPPYLNVDVTSIRIGHSIHVGEVTWPANIEILTPKSAPLFAVVGAKEEEPAAAPGAAAAPAEPELITKKKKEDEGEEGKDAKAGGDAKKDAGKK